MVLVQPIGPTPILDFLRVNCLCDTTVNIHDEIATTMAASSFIERPLSGFVGETVVLVKPNST